MSKSHASHLDEVLCDFSYTLLALVNHEIRPIYEFVVDLGEDGVNVLFRGIIVVRLKISTCSSAFV